METVESIERKLRLQKYLARVFISILVILLCLLIGWLISNAGYEGIDHQSYDSHLHAPMFSAYG